MNAGSNPISVFRANGPDAGSFVTLTDQASSPGILPISVAIFDHWVFVLNEGNATVRPSVAGFVLSSTGQLTGLPGPDRKLPESPGKGPAQLAFTPSGRVLVLTERVANDIVTFPVASSGAVGTPKTFAAANERFGFTISSSGILLVTEAASSSVGSFSVSASGTVRTLTGPLSDGQKAACWVSVTPNGGFAFVSNTASNTVSSCTVAHDGSLSLLRSVAASTAKAPADSAMGAGGAFLYVHSGAGEKIQGFAVHSDGSLSLVTAVGDLPPAAEGLVAY
jgi:6-phosphogluconolactonase